jgi:hypothetical protein
MTVTSITKIDFNELTRLISREIDSALRLSKLSKDWEGKLHISRLKIKLGRESPPSPKIHEDNRSVESSSLEPSQPFLLIEHYPPATEGWKFEMEFCAGPAPPQVRRLDGIWHVVTQEPLPTADFLFRNMPIKVIKGVNKRWAEKFKGLDISSVGMFISLKHSELLDVSRKTSSRYPLELFVKAQLLRFVVPEIPKSSADDYSLFELLGKSATDLRSLIGQNQISATASEQLYWLLSLLNIVIDRRVLRITLLKDLRRIPETNR